MCTIIAIWIVIGIIAAAVWGYSENFDDEVIALAPGVVILWPFMLYFILVNRDEK